MREEEGDLRKARGSVKGSNGLLHHQNILIFGLPVYAQITLTRKTIVKLAAASVYDSEF
jgi:hypothetical protein